MNTNRHAGPLAALAVAALLAAPLPAAAMQILLATDHGELAAEISNRAVSRIALMDDRIARVIRAPDGIEVEHDPSRGDLYLRPSGASSPERTVTLFVGTEKGFTYRLALAVRDRASAQILIRDPAAADPEETGTAPPSDNRIGVLAALVRAVARRELPPGHVIAAGDGGGSAMPLAATLIETWRGPRFTVRVLEVGVDTFVDAAELAAASGSGVAAAWLAAPGAGPSGGRIAVTVHAGGIQETAGEKR